MSDSRERIQQNLAAIRQRIAAAAARSGRAAEDVQLIAVTKYVGAREIEALLDADCLDLGESRPQTMWDKAQALAEHEISWHLIGHLQRNKIKRTLPLLSLLHSGDSLRLLEGIDQHLNKLGHRLPVLIEVNVSGDPEKHGFDPDSIESDLPQIAGLANLDVCGLMTMAKRGTSADEARRDFASLRNLRDRLAMSCPSQISLTQLSMGMSGDYEAAIEEGATIVRIGSALYTGIAGHQD